MRDIWMNIKQLGFMEWMFLMFSAPMIAGAWLLLALMIADIGGYCAG